MRILLTGATGKLGQEFLHSFLSNSRFSDWQAVALCHNRVLPSHDRIEIIRGSISERQIVKQAMRGVTHVVHLAAVKESPDMAMDVSVKGMFWMLEAARSSKTLKQFVLVSGDCTVGHMFQEYTEPVTEQSPRRAYPGCYALSKVLEEVMLEQYQIQYNLNGCCLRAGWIMEKDDFKYALKFDGSQFGGPPWSDYLGAKEIEEHIVCARIPLLLDTNGAPLKRNFVHISDLTRAISAAIDAPNAARQLFNISMNEPIDYAKVCQHLLKTRKLESVTIPTPHYSNWLDNSKARQLLDWSPAYDMEKLIDSAFTFERKKDDPRVVWYPG